MQQSSREIVSRALKFQTPERMPRQLWALPWASEHHPETIKELARRFPSDFGNPRSPYKKSPRSHGSLYEVGESVDEWGCLFSNIHKGIIGEVKTPLLPKLEDWKGVKPPYEMLPDDLSAARDSVNRDCAASDKFMTASCCPRPWERYQFIRGSENAMEDIAFLEPETLQLIKRIHEFHLKELEFWASTDVDALTFMDDWGSQNSLLINPATWREVFKPLYREYCQIAKAAGKLVTMHSDGNIQAIYPDLIEIGVDAVNSQLFCMDMDWLRDNAKGRIAFWGEIDRQHVLNSPDPEVAREAVRKVASKLYSPKGGVIAQLEFGPGANPQAVIACFEEWERIDREERLRP